MNRLEIKNLKKTYPNGVKAINDISLDLRNGMFGLLGPNGAGKSSLMRTIAGLQTPDSGSITFNDNDILTNPDAIRMHLGYLPQEFGVYPGISAYTLLDHLAVLKGVTTKSEREGQINHLLSQTNLLQHKNKSVYNFSGGMKQRFGIAQALLGNPKIIIVDEPTAGLDPEERNRFNNLLSEIGENIIVLLSTHFVEDVRDLCRNMAIISNGSVVTSGNPDAAIKSLENKIWSKKITRNELECLSGSYQIISSRLHAGQIVIRVYADFRPSDEFEQVTPELEDVYFFSLNESQNIKSHV